MTLNVNSGGTQTGKTTLYKRASSAWSAASTAYKRVSGAWVAFLSSTLTCTPNPANFTGVKGTGTKSINVTLSKSATGAGWVSGGTGITVSGSGTAYTFSASSGTAGGADLERFGTYRFNPTDGVGAACDVGVDFYFTGSV